MADRQRIKTRIITRDIKTIDRSSLLAQKMRSIAGRVISAAGSESAAAFPENREGRRSAEADATEKISSGTKVAIGSGFRVFYGTRGKASAAMKRALRALINAFRSLTAILMSGSGVVLVVIIIIVLIAALAASPFGIFLSNDPGAGGMTTREAVQTLNDEFSEYILNVEESYYHDELVVVYTGGMSQIDWKGVLAVYAAKVNQNGPDSIDVLSFDEEKQDILRGVMWDMNEVSHKLIRETRERKVVKAGEDGEPAEETETVSITTLKIIVTQRAPDEMAAVYAFTTDQGKALAELLEPGFDTLWEELLGGFISGGIGEPSKERIPTGPFTWPLEVPGLITSYFGWREDPFTGKTAYHAGIDLAIPEGTPILAAADGTVVAVNGLDTYGGGYGYYVKLSHAEGFETLYAHCSAVAVMAGDSVRQGQIIGYVGDTGRSKGPHLHWEVYSFGGIKDPLLYFT